MTGSSGIIAARLKTTTYVAGSEIRASHIASVRLASSSGSGSACAGACGSFAAAAGSTSGLRHITSAQMRCADRGHEEDAAAASAR